MRPPHRLPIIYATEHHCSEGLTTSENTIILPLTQGFFTVLDAADIGIIKDYKWFAHVGRDKRYVYASCSAGRMHRMLMGFPRTEVDHENHNTLDNRRCNLRVATHSQNRANARLRRDAGSPYKGIVWNNGSWIAQINAEGKHYYLGRFKDPIVAALAYDAAARAHFGEFARTNFGKDSTCLSLSA